MGTGEGYRGFASLFADRLPYGVAALAAAWFMLFGQASPYLRWLAPGQGEAFASWLCAGLVVCGAVVALLCLKDPYCPLPLRKRCPRLNLAMLVGGAALVAVGAALGSTTMLVAPPPVDGAPSFAPDAPGYSSSLLAAGGFAAGVGFSLMVVVALDQMARRSVRDLAVLASASLALFAVVHAALWFCSDAFSLLGLVALLALAVFTLCAPENCAAEAAVASSPAASSLPDAAADRPCSPLAERPEGEATTVLQRLSSIVRSSWGLYAVLLISMFLLGFNWDPPRLGLYPIRPALLTLEESLGAFAAALLLCTLRRMGSNADALGRLQWTVVPAVVATFIVVPYFPLESTGGFFYEFVGFVRCMSIFVFAGGFAVAQASVSRAADASLPFSAGLALALCGGCLGAGFLLARTLGTAVDMLVVLLFVASLVGMVVARSLTRGDAQKVRRIEREIFDAYLQQRCAAIAATYGLSPRESEILLYLSRGHGYVYIAELAFVSEGTVRTHAKSIFRKCGVSSREELLDLIDERPS